MQFSLRQLLLATVWAGCAIGSVLRGLYLLGTFGLLLFAVFGAIAFAAWCWIEFRWKNMRWPGRTVALMIVALASYPLVLTDYAVEDLDYLARAHQASELTRHLKGMLKLDSRYDGVEFTIQPNRAVLEVTVEGVVPTQAALDQLKSVFASSVQGPSKWNVTVEAPLETSPSP